MLLAAALGVSAEDGLSNRKLAIVANGTNVQLNFGRCHDYTTNPLLEWFAASVANISL